MSRLFRAVGVEMIKSAAALAIACAMVFGIGAVAEKVTEASSHSTIEIFDSLNNGYRFETANGWRYAYALEPTNYPCEELYWGEPELPPMVTTSWDGQEGTCEPAN